MGDVFAFLDKKRRLIETDTCAFIAVNLQSVDEISYTTNAQGVIIGGRIWVDDPYCHYCVTDEFIFTTYGEAVMASELFSEATHDVLVAFFADRFRSTQSR